MNEINREYEERNGDETFWIEKGSKFIYPERMEQWNEYVKAYIEYTYLRDALVLIKKLESGASMDEAKKMFDDQQHSGDSAEVVRRILFDVYKRGPEFYENTVWRDLSENEKRIIDNKKRENAELEELHREESSKELP